MNSAAQELFPAWEVAIAFHPVLDHTGDCAFCILDELHAGSFHGEVGFRVRDERDLPASTRIDRKAAPFQETRLRRGYAGDPYVPAY